MTDLTILGSTGSIGRQALEVAADLPGRLRPLVLTADKNWSLLAEQVRRWRPQLAVVADAEAYLPLKRELSGLPTQALAGEEGLLAAACWDEGDMVLAAISGAAGLKPLLAAVERGKDIALANKEALVCAGQLLLEAAGRSGSRLLPVDSEHSAIWQCLAGERVEDVDSLILTASGGAFRDLSGDELARVVPQQALAHPTWRMGAKITIDCATLVNKGLEIIEAHWLFNIPYERIRVVIHPQSVVHSLVAFRDGSIKAQLGPADMRLPIQYALLGQERPPTCPRPLDLTAVGRLDFFPPDSGRFPALDIIRRAGIQGGTAPAYINAVNEELAAAFLEGSLTYPAFITLLGELHALYQPQPASSLAAVLFADQEGRADARRGLNRR